MANQSVLKELLDKLFLQIRAFQQARETQLRNKELLRSQPGRSSVEKTVEQFSDVPLEIGNELLITAELVKIYKELSNFIGRVVIIDQILAKEGAAIKASAFGIQVDVEVKVAQQMRAAFLQRDSAWT